MKITTTKIVTKDYTLSDQDVKKAAIEYLRKIIPRGCTVSQYEGEQCVTEWIDTGHGSGLTEKLRTASEIDKAAALILTEI